MKYYTGLDAHKSTCTAVVVRENAKQMPGNNDLKSVLAYAKADGLELTTFAHLEWARHESLISTDIKRD